MARQDSKKANGKPQDFSSDPVAAVPDSLDMVSGEGFRFILHPAETLDFAYKLPDYLIFSPFQPTQAELWIEPGPLRRQRWTAGSAMFLPPKTLIRCRLYQPAEFLCITISAERIERQFQQSSPDHPITPRPIEEFIEPGFRALQIEARRALISDPVIEPLYFQQLLAGMLARIGCYFAGKDIVMSSRETMHPVIVRRIIEDIDKELEQKLSVSELAERAQLSRSHFSRAFQAATGESPQQYILSKRVGRARDLLAETEHSMNEVAALTGFSSQGHMATAFKKRLGLTPTEYRAAFGKPCRDDE
ncbi:MAG: helix-turn-helix domain-containing protein [Pseudomonadota bacterium]